MRTKKIKNKFGNVICLFYLCDMNKAFKYKIKQTTPGEGESEPIISFTQASVDVELITSSVEAEGVVYIFLSTMQERVKIVDVPKKNKPTKENPSGWESDTERKNVQEPLTIMVTEEDDIATFNKWLSSISI